MRHAIALAAALLPALLTALPAAAQHDDLSRQIETYLTKRPDRPYQVEAPPGAPVTIPDSARRDIRHAFQKRMALSGHGTLYDIDGAEVTLDRAEAATLLREMAEAALAEDPAYDDRTKPEAERIEALVAEGRKLAETYTLDDDSGFALRAGLIEALALRLDADRRDAYRWRVRYLENVLIGQIDLPREIIDYRGRLREFIWILLGYTDYMRDCARAGVPVPPDFAIAGSPWTHQGALTRKLIASSASADVWTWAPTTGRGACVALPRGSGVSGIICQSASTGNACFWDNIRRDGTQVNWRTETLVIKDLQDGSMLAENCTTCHKGNNVYLVSPDDPTWCRLLRGNLGAAGCLPVAGPNASRLTLAVEAPVNPVNIPNTSLIHPRYTPLSGTPARPAWVNDAGPGCGGNCHLGPNGAFGPPPMPPACGVDCYEP